MGEDGDEGGGDGARSDVAYLPDLQRLGVLGFVLRSLNKEAVNNEA